MEISFNDLKFGNLSRIDFIKAKSSCLADEAIPKILNKESKIVFPDNYSNSTKLELNEINARLKKLLLSPEVLNRFIKFDQDLNQMIASEFFVAGIDTESLIASIRDDIDPAILKLKEKFKRPRPFQLAGLYRLSLFPIKSLNSLTPSFPSKTAIQACVILNTISSRNPDKNDLCKSLISEICNSRVALGLNYQSDVDASYFIADEIMKLPSFTEKYKL